MGDHRATKNFILSRERSFIRPSSQYQQYLYHPGKSANKPTMEIYRPPNVRTDHVIETSSHQARLNVHAKEFTMSYGHLQPSRSSGNILVAMDPHQFYIQPVLHKLQPSLSSPRVHFALQPPLETPKTVYKSAENKAKNSQNEVLKHVRFQESQAPIALQRSKSLGAADILSRLTSQNSKESDLGPFSADIQNAISKAKEDPNLVPTRILMDLVRNIMERVLESRRHAEPAAKLCITIIENEKKETFLETLLNTCQQWYQERDRVLKSNGINRIPAFMAFLNEMYCQLKRRELQLKTHQEGATPGLIILNLLCKCCHDCLKSPSVSSLSDTESLFFVLTAIGKDLETELPSQLEILFSAVREAFLTAVTLPAIRKTLLQLIELNASRWQLPASAVIYYYPTSSSTK